MSSAHDLWAFRGGCGSTEILSEGLEPATPRWAASVLPVARFAHPAAHRGV